LNRVLIIGGSGFIGHNLANLLVKKKFKVTSISIKGKNNNKFNKKVNYIKGDICNLTFLKKIKFKFDYVINASGYYKTKQTFQYKKKLNENFNALKNILDILKKKNIKKFIQIGSSAEYENLKSPLKENFKCNPKNIYGIHKLKCTRYCMNFYKFNKLPITIIRIFSIYGEENNKGFIRFLFSKSINKQKTLIRNSNDTRDFLNIKELSLIIFKIMNTKKSDGEIINIGSGQPIKLKKIINFVNKISKTGYLKYSKKEYPELDIYPDISKLKKIIKNKINFNLNKDLQILNKMYVLKYTIK